MVWRLFGQNQKVARFSLRRVEQLRKFHVEEQQDTLTPLKLPVVRTAYYRTFGFFFKCKYSYHNLGRRNPYSDASQYRIQYLRVVSSQDSLIS